MTQMAAEDELLEQQRREVTFKRIDSSEMLPVLTRCLT